MPLFDNTGRLFYDCCAAEQRDADNRRLACYTFQGRALEEGGCAAGCGGDAWLDHRNLRRAATGCDDAAIREYGHEVACTAATRSRSRASRQLQSRVFGAAPDLSRGPSRPDCESQLILSGSASGGAAEGCTTGRFDAPKVQVSEADYDRFDPGVVPVCVDNVVAAWPRGGVSTRAAAAGTSHNKR